MMTALRTLLLANLLALLGQGGMEARAEEAVAKQEDMQTGSASAADVWTEVNARGTGPFWSLRIRADQITFSRAGKNNIIIVNPGPTAVTGNSATWTFAHPPSPFTLTLTREGCFDGTSARRYDFAAKLAFQGRTLYGCAASLAAIVTEPAP